MKKIWFCFRGPFECSAWAELWDKAKLLSFFKGQEPVEGVLRANPEFETLRVESHRGETDEDGRVYVWGKDEPSSGDGPDTQHEGVQVWLDGVLVYNDCVPTQDAKDDPDHDDDCELCGKDSRPKEKRKP